MKVYDVAIIGAGAGGVTAAQALVNQGMSVLLLERGRDILKRRDTISGWFGRALYGMHRVRLNDPTLRNTKVFKDALTIVHKVTRWKNVSDGAVYMDPPIECAYELATYFYNDVFGRADVHFDAEVTNIVNEKVITIMVGKKEFKANRCILASGRYSLIWLHGICSKLNLPFQDVETHIGIRVEIPNRIAKDSVDINHDLILNDVVGDDISQHSFISEWEEGGILSAQACSAPQKSNGQTSLMLGFKPDESAEDIIRNVKIINVLSNDKIRRERIKDFVENKSILQHIKMFDRFHETFEELNEKIPSFINSATMYIPEVRWNGILSVNAKMKTEVSGIYGVGECTTRASTIIGAMASGLIAARTILGEEK